MESLKELLTKHAILNRTELGRMMWPNIANAGVRMPMKLHEKERQRFTEKDEKLAADALRELHKDIGGYIRRIDKRGEK